MLLRYAFLLFLIGTPFSVSANIFITEIMYDQEGSDAGREWVEIYNDGEALDLADWHFYENEVHHSLIFEGSTIIASQQRIIIVQDVERMQNDFGSSVDVVKSSYSLNNQGEKLAISNPEKEIISEITYSSEWGAVGDGQSLQWNGNSWISAAPTPGKQNASISQDIVSATSSTSKKTSAEIDTSKKPIIEDYYQGSIAIKNNAVAKSPVTIEAFVDHVKNGKSTKRIGGGVYFVNFGDGSYVESQERISVEHIYDAPGTYRIIFEFYPSRLHKEHEDPTVLVMENITIYGHDLQVIDYNERSLISIKNNSAIDINISGWDITNGIHEFTFPKHSSILSGETNHIPFKVHNLVSQGLYEPILLRNADNNTIHTYQKIKPEKKEIQNNLNTQVKDISPESAVGVLKENNAQTILPLEHFLEQHPNKEYAEFNDVEQLKSPDIIDNNKSLYATIFGLGLFGIILGIGKFMYARKNEEKELSKDQYSSIELIE